MNQAHTTDTGSLSLPAGDFASITFAAAEPLQPDFVFPSQNGNELRITPTGLIFRGEPVTDGGQVYHALMAALGQGARGVTFFRRRDLGGIWIEADEHVLEIIQNQGGSKTYEACVMYAAPVRAPLSASRLKQLADDYSLSPEAGGERLQDLLFSFANAARAEA